MILAEFTAEVNNIQVENLYQWDTNQTVKISGIDFGVIAPQVHFCNKKSETALAVQGILQSDGSVIASVPNSLLTEPYDITAYIYLKTGVIGNTIKCIVLPVIARQMPSDYVLTSDENIAEIHEIELEAKAIIDNLTASAYSATESYKRPNIVYYNNGAYMCKSSTAVTGVAPTDTTVWQLLCKGMTVSNVTLNSSGDLVFTFDNGSTKTVEISSTEASLIDIDLDIDTVPNAVEVNNIKLTINDDSRINCILDRNVRIAIDSDRLRVEGTKAYLKVFLIRGKLYVGKSLVYKGDVGTITDYVSNVTPAYYELSVPTNGLFDLKRGETITTTLEDPISMITVPQRVVLWEGEMVGNNTTNSESFTIYISSSRIVDKTIEIEIKVKNIRYFIKFKPEDPRNKDISTNFDTYTIYYNQEYNFFLRLKLGFDISTGEPNNSIEFTFSAKSSSAQVGIYSISEIIE